LKLIAHRGWAAGRNENTLAAFARAARDHRLSGVEFDVRREPNSETLVVSHDPPLGGATVLTLDAALSFLAGTGGELFVELKQAGIAPAVIETLLSAGVASRSVVFAFADVARSFPWQGARPVRLGVIVEYPWTMNRLINAYAPDVILLGWDERGWTRVAFRVWWSIFSLERLAARRSAAVVVGIVRRAADIHWLSKQHIYAAVADMDVTYGAPR
jgi:glycerophosphoryl diester phosphodiesterase family protein